MAGNITEAKEPLEARAERLYHHVLCKPMKGLKITLTKEGQEQKRLFSILGVSSKETIRTGLKAVDASPFKTVFVIDERSGEILFALSKNAEFVKANRKKDPPPPPPPPPTSQCCQICFAQGGYACDTLSDGSCICYGASRGGAATDIESELGTLG
jgi:hypothetical protein